MVSFESSDLRTRDRQREDLERVDLLFVDLDGMCQEYRHLHKNEITLAKLNSDVHPYQECANMEWHSDWKIDRRRFV